MYMTQKTGHGAVREPVSLLFPTSYLQSHITIVGNKAEPQIAPKSPELENPSEPFLRSGPVSCKGATCLRSKQPFQKAPNSISQ